MIKVGSFIDVDIKRRQFIFESSTLEKIDHNTAYFTVFYGSVQKCKEYHKCLGHKKKKKKIDGEKIGL